MTDYLELRRQLRENGRDAFWWSRLERLWILIGLSEAIRHNLLVLTMADDIEVRRGAAFEVATSIAAVAFTAVQS